MTNKISKQCKDKEFEILDGRISIFRMGLKSHARICDRADGWNVEPQEP